LAALAIYSMGTEGISRTARRVLRRCTTSRSSVGRRRRTFLTAIPNTSTVIIAVSLLLAIVNHAHGQVAQWVKGTVVDKESRIPLAGAVVRIADMDATFAQTTDSAGHFSIAGVTTGKHIVATSYMGYHEQILPDVLVTSGKEVILVIELEEAAVKMKEVTISSKREHVNEMAVVSAKTFDVQETERYAGSRADPARMVSNFAGVQGGNDSRNDIVVRGNSPQGVLWRLEGIDIPNPNHFSVPGTTGGPVTMLNSKVLANCDFFTGAFPAEYGNGVAAAFDLKFRNGNSERYEYTAQLGLLGTELAVEGPLSKKTGASFLVAYRYSTLQLFQSFNIKIGTSSVPRYQDLNLKVNLPLGKKDNLSFFGIAGTSSIDLVVSKLTAPTSELYGESDRDQYFTSGNAVAGAQYRHTFSNKVYTQVTIAQTVADVVARHEKVFRNTAYGVDSLKHILGFNFRTFSTVAHWMLNKKISATQTLRVGLLSNYYYLNLADSSRQYPTTLQQWQHRLNFTGGTQLLQAYLQYKFRPHSNITVNTGLHGQYLTHNASAAIEPRIAMLWLLGRQYRFTAGYGLHSQLQPLYQYFAQLPGSTVQHNREIGFTRSHHLIAGVENTIKNSIRLKVETYYQYLFDVPIETRVNSSYSALNQGSSFSRDFPGYLQNTGVGYNYGAEFTAEKRMQQGYYVLLTGSVFDSRAKGNDGIYRNTDFNTGYAANALMGFERPFGKHNTLIGGAKVTIAGGRLYSPVDTGASRTYGDAVVVDAQRNTLRLPAYFRADIRLGVRLDRNQLTHEICVDLVNLLNTKNVLSYAWSYDLATQGKQPFYYQYQLGFLPLFYYRVDFGGKRSSK
jgi:hypothetical protein